MNMSDIHCFLKVAECMSFSKAADVLFISQQAVSLHIKKLEEEYQVKFFERKPKLKLTQAGHLLQEAAQDIIDRENILLDQLNISKNSYSGEFAIGLPPNRSTPFANEFIPQFSTIYPNMTIKLLERTSNALPFSILQNEIDIALILSSPYSEFPDPDLFVSHSIETENLYLVISDGLLETYFPNKSPDFLDEWRKTGVSLYSLAHIPMFLHPETSRLHATIYKKFLLNGTPPFIRVKTTLTSSLVYLCEQNYGIFFSNLMSLKSLYYSHHACFEHLHVFPVLEFQNNRQSLLIYHRQKRLTQPMIDGIKIIKNLYQQHTSIASILIS